MKNDLTYRKQGIFTVFIPENESGETAWRAIASQTQGTGKVFTSQLPVALAQLRKAGFTVKSAKKAKSQGIDKEIEFFLAEI